MKIKPIMAFLLANFLITLTGNAQAHDWTQAEIGGEIAYLTLQSVDWLQTRYIAAHPDNYYEALNPALGVHPSIGRVNAWFAAMSIIQPVIANVLPHNWRAAWIASGVFLEMDMATRNAGIGVKLYW